MPKLQHRVLHALVVLGVIANALAVPVSGMNTAEFEDWVNGVGEKSQTTTASEVNLASSSGVKKIYVDQAGNGDFKTIKAALGSLGKNSETPAILYIAPGTYKEHIVIKNMGPLTFQGSGMTKTKITYDLNAGEAGGTLLSASFAVSTDNFIAKDIAFENSRPAQAPGAVNKQAVAFMIAGDKAAFYRCAFLGYQDTLYDRAGRHYFKDCYIRGSIDYIFGDGKSFYDTCYLDTQTNTYGSLTAQKRLTTKEDTGYVFSDCTVGGGGYIYLGRAWGPASRVVFIKTYFANNILPEGWFDWGVPAREKTVFYGEYECTGPGSNRAGRVPWSYELSPSQVKPFLTKESWIGNWVPAG